MSQSELTAWALWVSETWYSAWNARDVMRRLGTTKSRLIFYKARGIVVFDRVLNGRTEQ